MRNHETMCMARTIPHNLDASDTYTITCCDMGIGIRGQVQGWCCWNRQFKELLNQVLRSDTAATAKLEEALSPHPSLQISPPGFIRTSFTMSTNAQYAQLKSVEPRKIGHVGHA